MHLTPSPRSPAADAVIYPSGDGRPLAETPVHRRNLVGLIDVLDRRFAEPLVYVSGNMFVYYVPGNKRKHVAPDVFLVRGVPKDTPRDYYLVWEEGRGPDLVIELTSATTADEDLMHKKRLYQDVLGVSEYVLFDPRGEYLNPALQGFRLEEGKYVPIAPVAGRLPSLVTGLEFEACGEDLRLYDPATGRWLPTAEEFQAETSERLTEVSAENERLQQELAELRRQLGQKG